MEDVSAGTSPPGTQQVGGEREPGRGTGLCWAQFPHLAVGLTGHWEECELVSSA